MTELVIEEWRYDHERLESVISAVNDLAAWRQMMEPASLAGQAEQVAGLAEQVAGLDERVRVLEGSRWFAELRKLWHDMEQRLAALETRPAPDHEHSQYATAHEHPFATLSHEHPMFMGALAELSERHGALAAQSQSHALDLLAAKRELDGIARRVSDLETAGQLLADLVESVSERTRDIPADVAQLRAQTLEQHTWVAGSMGQLEHKLDRDQFERHQDSYTRDMQAVTERLLRLEQVGAALRTAQQDLARQAIEHAHPQYALLHDHPYAPDHHHHRHDDYSVVSGKHHHEFVVDQQRTDRTVYRCNVPGCGVAMTIVSHDGHP